MDKISQIKSIDVANVYLTEIEKNIIKYRLEQSQARDKREWYRINEKLAELNDERRALRRHLAKLEVIEHEEAKAEKALPKKRFGRAFR